ncbi:MAG TPA: hypothetical protein VF384_13855 [Planctomycetota bacterium]
MSYPRVLDLTRAAMGACLTLALATTCRVAAAQRPTTPAARSVVEGGVFTSFYENGGVRERGRVDGGGKRTGAWRLSWPNGRLAADGEYSKGERQGQWIWRDQYGRPTEYVSYGVEQRQGNSQLGDMLPLRVADLRDGIVGATTVGALVDRFAAAGEDDAGDAERAEVARALAAAPPEAIGVPFSIAEGLPAASRARWLRLCAAMPMPERMPLEQLRAWCEDPACGAPVEEVLTAWSRQFAGQWQPLLEPAAANNLHAGLQRLGPKALGALPELRRRMADGTLRGPLCYALASIHGLDRQSPAAPWLAALDRAAGDAGRRAEAAQVLAGLAGMQWQQGPPVPAATIVRLLADPCPAVADAAGTMLGFRLDFRQRPEEFDDQVDQLANGAAATTQLAAATRLAALGRVAEAESIWFRIASSEPASMYGFDSWNLLVQHARDQAAVRDLLLAVVEKGRLEVLAPLLRVAGDEARVLDLLVEHVRSKPWFLHAGLLTPQVRGPLRGRLLTLIDDPRTPGDQRRNLFSNLFATAAGDDARRDAIERGIGNADAAIGVMALEHAERWGVTPTAAQWQVLLRETQSRERAAAVMDRFPLPQDLDPTPWPVPRTVLATWADGQPQRIAQLVESWLAGNRQAFDALLLLRADLRAVQHRAPPVTWVWTQSHPDAALVRELMPGAAAEQRIRDALVRRSDVICCPVPRVGREGLALLPVDEGMMAAIRRRLLDDSAAQRAVGLQLLTLLGADGRPLLAALEEALPKFTAAELVLLPPAVCAIAPDAAIRLCEPLLEHADPAVVAAAVLGPQPIRHEDAPRVPGGAAFARKIAARIVASEIPQTCWFAALEDGIAALPTLREALCEQPRRYAIAAAIGSLGPAAAAAVPELLAAMPHNPHVGHVVAAVLPPEARKATLLALLGTEHEAHILPLLSGLRLEGAVTLAAIERLAGDGREEVRLQARALLACSASETATADEARRERLAHPERGLHAVEFEHCVRVWPRLSDAERKALVAQMGNSRAVWSMPVALADAIAPMLQEDDGSAFRALLAGAPLHPRVLERIEASARFWNAPAVDPRWNPRARHARALVQLWPAADAACRARALPWLRREADTAVQAAQEELLAPGRWAPLEFLELMQQLACSQSCGPTFHFLNDADLNMRRAALRAWLASAQEPNLVQTLHALLCEASWEERFGPLEGLPPACAEIVAKLPAAAERAAKLRQQCGDPRPDTVHKIAADLPAARLLLPELRQMLDRRKVEQCAAVMWCLRRLGPDAAALLPEVEALSPIPWLHFEVKATASILRGEAPAAPAPVWPVRGPGSPAQAQVRYR